MVRLAPCRVREYFGLALRCVHPLLPSDITYSIRLFVLVGYDTGVISGALVTIGGDLGPAELSSGQKVRPAEMHD